ncbi:MAG: AAA family ATPase, partial [Acidimicrobiales bacterium]
MGRAPELSALRDARHEAEAGRGSWVNVVGEAGIGKTRLVGELVGTGGRVVIGRCSVVDRATTYRPLAEALLAISTDVPVPVPNEIAPYAAALARFVPAWRGPSSVASESPAVLGESVLRLLRWWGEPGAAVLVVEDLHWADPETLAACEYVADHLAATRVVVVATWRPDEVPGIVSRMLRHHRSLDLAPLTSAEVEELATGCLGQAPSAPTLERLTRTGNGLPLLVEDLLDSDAAAPARFAGLVAARLGQLPSSSVPAVVAAALLGERFELPLVVAARGGDKAGTAQAMREAMAAGLLVADGGAFRFRHALTHDAVLAAAPAVRAEMTGPVAAALSASASASASP